MSTNNADSMDETNSVSRIAETNSTKSVRTRTATFSHLAKLVISLEGIENYRLHPTTHDRIADKLAGRGPALAQGPESVRIYFGVDGSDITIAQKDAMDLVTEVIDELGLKHAEILSLEIAVPRSEKRLEPDLVGLREVATLLGISHQRVAQLAKRTDFPRPIQRLRATPVWVESDIRKFAFSR
jgi:predicted DNA-binding transcriptional regulator AlpA